MPVIKEVFAFIIADKNDEDEGVPGVSTSTGVMPLLGADIDRAHSLKPLVQDLANKSGKRITLAKFSVREDVEVIQPILGPTTIHKPKTCPSCSTMVNAATGFKNDDVPSPGDVTVCLMCQAVLTFDENMELQVVSDAELRAMNQEDRRTLFEARAALRELRTKIGGIIGGPDSTH